MSSQINEIRCTSKISTCVDPKNNTFYTMEYSESRTVSEGSNIEVERNILWDAVNNQVDTQMNEVLKLINVENLSNQ